LICLVLKRKVEKMSINSREDANRYYNLINGLVDNYIDKWKIRPSSLRRYLQPGSERFNKFLERNKLKDIKGAEVILKDVIDDRAHMESDGVITFESFKILESNEFKIHSMKQCLYKGIEKADIKMEKILADVFDTNLGSIDIVDSDKHTFKIEDWEGENIKAVIYSSEEMDIIKYNMIEFLYDELSKKSVKITDSIDIDLDSIIDYESFSQKSESKFDMDFVVKIVTECLGEDFQFKYETENHFIWIS